MVKTVVLELQHCTSYIYESLYLYLTNQHSFLKLVHHSTNSIYLKYKENNLHFLILLQHLSNISMKRIPKQVRLNPIKNIFRMLEIFSISKSFRQSISLFLSRKQKGVSISQLSVEELYVNRPKTVTKKPSFIF